MLFKAFMKELKSNTPSFEKAEKWLRYGGYVTLAAAVWNFGFGWFADPGMLPRYWNPALAVLGTAGVFFILGAGGISLRHAQGALLGQVGIVLLIGVLAVFMAWMVFLPGTMAVTGGAKPSLGLTLVFGGFSFIVFLQFAVPGVFAIRYLNRLGESGGSEDSGSQKE